MDIYNFTEGGGRDMTGGMVGGNLRSARIEKNMTQEQVAEAADINPKYLGEIERNEKKPTTVVINRLVHALGVPVCRLFNINNCLCRGNAVMEQVAKIFTGRTARQLRKAVRLMEVFFE